MNEYTLPDEGSYLATDLCYAPLVDTGHWQGLKDVPQTKTMELTNVLIDYKIPYSSEELVEEIQPNLPWAEDHFQERVGGKPLNPGEQYKNWPWYKGNVAAHQSGLLQFSHTYMERFWPRFAPDGNWSPKAKQLSQGGQHGLRYRVGDLNDLISLLAREPYTRQAVLPVFFPEDTGAHHGGRIPCTLYYHFILRDGRLNINYTIRSCDFLRHFRDDVYMAVRLCQWMLDELSMKAMKDDPDTSGVWNPVTNLQYGTLTMLCHSLHIFEGDLPKMRREYG